MVGDRDDKLVKAAARYLARRSYSRGEMSSKLAKLGTAAEVECALEELEDLKLLNDSEYAYNFAFHRLSVGGWGPNKIRQTLRRRLVAPELVERALSSVQESIGIKSALAAQLDKFCRRTGMPHDAASIRRVIAHLQRRGFAGGLIRELLRQRGLLSLSARWSETGE